MAIHAIGSKVEEMKQLLKRTPVDIKLLQQLLQGTLLVTVNAGPIAIKEAFLSEKNIRKYDQKDIEQLQTLLLEDFLHIFKEGLEVNGRAAQKDDKQRQFHEAVLEGYIQLREQLTGIHSSSDLIKSPVSGSNLWSSISMNTSNGPSTPQSPLGNINHTFKTKSFLSPTFCAQCTKFIYGVAKQGQWCEDCHFPVHDHCVPDVPPNCSKAHQKWDRKAIRSCKLDLENCLLESNEQIDPYANLAIRMNSFEITWKSRISMDYLAIAGFVFEPTPDSPSLIRCFCCQTTVKDLQEDDDVLEIHKKQSPDCLYLNSITQEEMITQYNSYLKSLKNRIAKKNGLETNDLG